VKRIQIPIWSRLTRLQRILLGVIVAIVALFIVAVGVGSGRGDGDPSHPGGFVALLGKAFGQPPPVNPADLSGACVPAEGVPANKTLAVSGKCVLRVAKGDADLRQLKVRAHGAVTVEAPVPRGDDTATKKLADGEDLAITVKSDGADIMLTCGADACAIELR
jgi:hypothetical protein